MLGTSVPSFAFDPKVVDEVTFQIECAILLFNDPAEHLEVCGVGTFGSPESLVDSGPGIAAPVPPPAPGPTEEEEDEPCPCCA